MTVNDAHVIQASECEAIAETLQQRVAGILALLNAEDAPRKDKVAPQTSQLLTALTRSMIESNVMADMLMRGLRRTRTAPEEEI